MANRQIIKDASLNYFNRYLFVHLTWDFWRVLGVKSDNKADPKSGISHLLKYICLRHKTQIACATDECWEGSGRRF